MNEKKKNMFCLKQSMESTAV